MADRMEGAETGGTKGAAPEADQGGASGDEGGEAGGVRSGQVRYITRPKSEAMRVTRQLRAASEESTGLYLVPLE